MTRRISISPKKDFVISTKFKEEDLNEGKRKKTQKISGDAAPWKHPFILTVN